MTAGKSSSGCFEDDIIEHTLDIVQTSSQRCSLLVSVRIDRPFGWYACGGYFQNSVKMATPTYLMYYTSIQSLSNGIYICILAGDRSVNARFVLVQRLSNPSYFQGYKSMR